jgi:hypothetical protein
MSKLYTEEQVKQMIEKSRETGLTAEYLILTSESIQLPTDEEIEKEFTMGNQIFTDRINGAKWMRDKIEGGQE